MISFKNLNFQIENNKVFLCDFGLLHGLKSRIAEVQLAGGNKITDMGTKMVNSSEGLLLQYHSHNQDEAKLQIVQRSERTEVTTTFESYEDTNALRIHTAVKNISAEPVVLEEVSSFVFTGLPFDSAFTRFSASSSCFLVSYTCDWEFWICLSTVQSAKRPSKK